MTFSIGDGGLARQRGGAQACGERRPRSLVVPSRLAGVEQPCRPGSGLWLAAPRRACAIRGPEPQLCVDEDVVARLVAQGARPARNVWTTSCRVRARGGVCCCRRGGTRGRRRRRRRRNASDGVVPREEGRTGRRRGRRVGDEHHDECLLEYCLKRGRAVPNKETRIRTPERGAPFSSPTWAPFLGRNRRAGSTSRNSLAADHMHHYRLYTVIARFLVCWI